MNTLILAAGVVAGATTIGHFVMGSKLYLKPTLEASFDPVAKRIMHCLFHYSSVFLLLSTIALVLLGSVWEGKPGADMLVLFIAANFAGFALWQLIIAVTSELENGAFKLFQWVFFVLIAGLAWAGA